MQQRHVWLKGLQRQKARYPLYAVAVLFFFGEILVHDYSILHDINTGQTDINSASQVYLPLTLAQIWTLREVVAVSILVLTGLAILIRITQWQYKKQY
jgi:hypothetical protein